MSECKTSGFQHSMRILRRSLDYFMPYKTRIVDRGAHAAFLARCEICQRLYELQYGSAS